MSSFYGCGPKVLAGCLALDYLLVRQEQGESRLLGQKLNSQSTMCISEISNTFNMDNLTLKLNYNI